MGRAVERRSLQPFVGKTSFVALSLQHTAEYKNYKMRKIESLTQVRAADVADY